MVNGTRFSRPESAGTGIVYPEHEMFWTLLA